jgi:hypothetical protein
MRTKLLLVATLLLGLIPLTSPGQTISREALREIWRRGDAFETGTVDRTQRRTEFLHSSALYLAKTRDDSGIWMLRTLAALEIGESAAAVEGSQQMARLNVNENSSPLVPVIRRELARRGLVSSPQVKGTGARALAILAHPALINADRKILRSETKVATESTVGAAAQQVNMLFQRAVDATLSGDLPVANELFDQAAKVAFVPLVEINRASVALMAKDHVRAAALVRDYLAKSPEDEDYRPFARLLLLQAQSGLEIEQLQRRMTWMQILLGTTLVVALAAGVLALSARRRAATPPAS